MGIISTLSDTKTSGEIGDVWTFDAGTPIYSDIIIEEFGEEEKIIFKSDREELFMLSKEGKKIWSFSLEGNYELEELFLDRESVKVVCCNPVIADINDDGKKEIIIGGENGKLFALDCNGKKLWQFKCPGAIRSTPAIADINNDGKPEIIFGANDHNLYVLDNGGNIIWTFKADLEIESGVLVADINNDGKKEIIVGSNDNNIYALNCEGDLIWKFGTCGPVNATPKISDIHKNKQPKIIVGSNDSYLYVLNSDGTLEWKYKTNGRIVSEVAIADINADNKEEIIVTSCSYEDNLLILSNMRDKIGSFGAGFWVTSNPVINNLNKDGDYEIVFGSYDHHLYVIHFKKDLKQFYRGDISEKVKIFNNKEMLISTPGIINSEVPLIIAASGRGRVRAWKLE